MNCDQGRQWLTKEQVENGVTTKRIEIVKCDCCKGSWRDCMKCYLKVTYG